jgi:hypothetical protein
MDARPPITDSPWFWVLMFSVMGFGALAAISGKYGQRQAGIERQYQARERVAEAGPQGAAQIAPRPYATPGNTLIPLWPLAVVLGAGAIVATAMLVRNGLRGRGRPGSPSNGS